MVLWELTLATAYVLGLRRTYRIALRGQRRLLLRRFPSLYDFTRRRTRNIFDVALAVHKRIQEHDISSRGLSNFILRALDRLRPQANIRCASERSNASVAREVQKKTSQGTLASRSTFEAGIKEDTSKNSGQLKFSPYRKLDMGCLGMNARSKVNTAQGRIGPNLSTGSLSGLMGTRWQPIRQTITGQNSKINSISSGMPFSTATSWSHYARKELTLARSDIIRDDIAKWMGRR